MSRSLAMLAAAALFFAGAVHAHPLDYRIDTVHSQVLFSADHDGYSNPVGRLAIARGWLRFDPDDWTASKVVADIDLASADLGDKGWNAAVTGHNFLDTAQFPVAHFESDAVTKTGDGTGTLEGRLTLRGATLDRTQFGMTAFPKAVGTQVTIRLEIEATLDRGAERDYREAANKLIRSRAHAAAQH
jgi:polyisoprenoid-binding protein YceI